MNDERLIHDLRALDQPVEPDPGFDGALYSLLERELARPARTSRPLILLLAAALLVALSVGLTLAIGGGLNRGPFVVASPTPTADEPALAGIPPAGEVWFGTIQDVDTGDPFVASADGGYLDGYLDTWELGERIPGVAYKADVAVGVVARLPRPIAGKRLTMRILSPDHPFGDSGADELLHEYLADRVSDVWPFFDNFWWYPPGEVAYQFLDEDGVLLASGSVVVYPRSASEFVSQWGGSLAVYERILAASTCDELRAESARAGQNLESAEPRTPVYEELSGYMTAARMRLIEVGGCYHP